jgi:prevent-host-death family protein
MRGVNVATLKNQLSKYLTFAKAGEEVIIRERNLPVAKLVPFSAEDADEQELRLVAEGRLRLPTARLNLREFLKMSAKGGGSLQIAASLIWCDERPARRNFVYADRRLSGITRSIGFTVLELY